MIRQREPQRATTDEVVVVTGASSGIGRDAALYLNELGYRVVATVRKSDDAERLERAAAEPDAFHPVLADVTVADDLARAGDEVEQIAGGGRRLAAVFSNAGIAMFSGELSAERCPMSTMERVMEVNHFGAVRVAQTFLPQLRASRGTIVFNSAMMARTVLPFNAGYAPSKRALEAYADTLRREVGPLGVRVVLIEAGAIVTSLENDQDPSSVPDDPPYAAQRKLVERFTSGQRDRGGDPRSSPRRFSEKVAVAIQHPRPRTRYIVGGGSKLLWTIGALPDRVQDELVNRLILGRR